MFDGAAEGGSSAFARFLPASFFLNIGLWRGGGHGCMEGTRRKQKKLCGETTHHTQGYTGVIGRSLVFTGTGSPIGGRWW